MEHWENKSLSNLIYIDDDNIQCEEQWKDIRGYEGIYAVSNLGRVKSYSRLVPQRNQVNKRRERILSQTLNINGYCKIVLFVNKIRKDTLAHILVAEAFIPNNINRPQVNHKWGNKRDNRPSQLEWNTAKENSNHAIEIGIDSVVGENNGRAILTEEQVLEIKRTYKKLPYNDKRKFANSYPVSASVVRKIAYGDLWKHLNNSDGCL